MNNIKVGDKVKCIDNKEGQYNLTIGKIYTVLKKSSKIIEVQQDNGFINSFYQYRFVLCKNERETKRYPICDFLDKINQK